MVDSHPILILTTGPYKIDIQLLSDIYGVSTDKCSLLNYKNMGLKTAVGWNTASIAKFGITWLRTDIQILLDATILDELKDSQIYFNPCVPSCIISTHIDNFRKLVPAPNVKIARCSMKPLPKVTIPLLTEDTSPKEFNSFNYWKLPMLNLEEVK